MKRLNKIPHGLLLVTLIVSAFAFYSFVFAGKIDTAIGQDSVISPAITSHNTSAIAKKEDKKTKKIKVALLLDTSNSMDGLIEQAKSQLWILVEELSKATCNDEKPQVEIALYEYGNDRLSAREGYIRMVTPLTYDLDKISADLFKLTTNGGSEFCGHVIQTALKQLDWSSDGGDYQVIFIAGNEEFTQGSVNYKEACAMAKNKNVVVNTIFCGPYNEGIQGMWKDGADISNGSYMSIEQDRKTVFIPSPYDDRIAQLNSQLNKTYIAYGSKGFEKKENQTAQDNNALSYGKGNEVKRAVSKSSHIYKNDSWDLVDASEEESFDMSKIKTEELPAEMKTMSEKERNEYIVKKKGEREKIKSEIIELNKSREHFVAQQTKNNGDDKTLDKAMIQSIRKQAASKQLTFK
jgi:hypothetical protein